MTDQLERVRALEKEVSLIKTDVQELKTHTAVAVNQYEHLIEKLRGIDAHIAESRTDNKWTFRLLVGFIFSIFSTIVIFYINSGLTI